MTKFLEDGRVVGQRSLSHDIRIMEIWSPQVAASAEPGQFVTVKSNDLSVPLLRRPFGVSGVNRDKGTFLLIYRIVGEATQLLDQLRKGILSVSWVLWDAVLTGATIRFFLLAAVLVLRPFVSLRKTIPKRTWMSSLAPARQRSFLDGPVSG